MTTIGARLKDPRMVLKQEDGSYDNARLAELQTKITNCMTRLYRQPSNGGNPFLFALTAPKPHELADELPGHPKGMFTTAATDGKKFYWHPDFLASLNGDEVPVVMEHEGYHVIFYHCQRGLGMNPRIFNWAIDYVVNAVIEISREKAGFKGPKLWGGALGEALPFAELLAFIDGKQEIPDDGKSRVFADKTLHGRSPESIYEEIMKHWDKSPRKCPQCGALSMDPKTGKAKKQGQGQQGQGGKGQKPGQKGQSPGQGQGQGQNGQQPGGGQGQGPHQCGDGHGDPGDHSCPKCGSSHDPLSSMDAHMQAAVTKEEVMSDVMRAAQAAVTMRGSVPSDIEDVLGELYKPTLKFTDIVRSALMRKVQDAGMKNDWKRLRRRWLNATPKQYLPRRHTHMPRWLAMIDTSGSMSDDDLRYGLSQLQVLGDNTEGHLVCCDASPKWDEVQRVTQKSDIKRTKIVGRGGTVFDQFFAEFPEKLGKEFDVVIIITDGDCGVVPEKLRPSGMDVVWVITRKSKEYKPSFGRVAPLRNSRL